MKKTIPIILVVLTLAVWCTVWLVPNVKPKKVTENPKKLLPVLSVIIQKEQDHKQNSEPGPKPKSPARAERTPDKPPPSSSTEKSKDAGVKNESFPPLYCDYQKVGLRQYLSGVTRAGGVFFFQSDDDVLHRIISMEKICLLSEQPPTEQMGFVRALERDQELQTLTGGADVAMAFPDRVDRQIVSALKTALEKSNYSADEIREFRGDYAMSSGRIYIQVHSVSTHEHGERPFSLKLPIN